MEDRAGGTAVDAALARRLVAGDETALADAYDQHAPLVYGLALRVIGDARAAEDVTQEVFLGLWEAPERFDADRGTLRGFLGTITHRRSVDLIRREEARRRREDRAPADPTGPSVDDQAVAGVVAERVRRAVDTLPHAQRRAIELAYFDGHSYRQVAALLGIPEGTAKSRLRLALAHIADVLDPELAERWA
jgi:RNA polymerase sigma-70 factor (ECF subfamily)